MDITGSWTGVITYGKEYRKYQIKKLFFDMEIIHEGEIITGSSIDISGDGMNTEPATIKGTFKSNDINFIKQYSTFHYYNKGRTKIDKSKKGYEIIYTGRYFDLKNKFFGEWIIHLKAYFLGIVPVKIKTTGTWEM